MVFSQELGKIINTMITLSKKNMYEYMTPEYLLYLITYNEKFEAAFINCGGDINKLRDDILRHRCIFLRLYILCEKVSS